MCLILPSGGASMLAESACRPPMTMCPCGSTKPGSIARPLRSISCVFGPFSFMTCAFVPTATILPPASATASARIAWSFIVRIGPPVQIRSAIVCAPDAVRPKQAAANTMSLQLQITVASDSHMPCGVVMMQRVTPKNNRGARLASPSVNVSPRVVASQVRGQRSDELAPAGTRHPAGDRFRLRQLRPWALGPVSEPNASRPR